MSGETDLPSALLVAAVPMIIGVTLLKPRPHLIDISNWLLGGIPLVGLLVIISVTTRNPLVTVSGMAAAFVASLMLGSAWKQARNLRFLVPGLQSNDLKALADQLAARLQRTGYVRTDPRPVAFSNEIEFGLGPVDAPSGLTWLGFRERLTKADKSSLNEVLGSLQHRGPVCVTLAWAVILVSLGPFVGWLYLLMSR